MSEANTQGVNEALTMTLEEAIHELRRLRQCCASIALQSLNEKRLRPTAVCRLFEHYGVVDRVPATAEHAASARCEIGEHVWVLSDRFGEYAA